MSSERNDLMYKLSYAFKSPLFDVSRHFDSSTQKKSILAGMMLNVFVFLNYYKINAKTVLLGNIDENRFLAGVIDLKHNFLLFLFSPEKMEHRSIELNSISFEKLKAIAEENGVDVNSMLVNQQFPALEIFYTSKNYGLSAAVSIGESSSCLIPEIRFIDLRPPTQIFDYSKALLNDKSINYGWDYFKHLMNQWVEYKDILQLEKTDRGVLYFIIGGYRVWTSKANVRDYNSHKPYILIEVTKAFNGSELLKAERISTIVEIVDKKQVGGKIDLSKYISHKSHAYTFAQNIQRIQLFRDYEHGSRTTVFKMALDSSQFVIENTDLLAGEYWNMGFDPPKIITFEINKALKLSTNLEHVMTYLYSMLMHASHVFYEAMMLDMTTAKELNVENVILVKSMIGKSRVMTILL